jgi:hypothetical protein
VSQRESDPELAPPKSLGPLRAAMTGYLLWIILAAAVAIAALIWLWPGPADDPSSTDPDLRPDKAGVLEKGAS